MNTKIWVFVVVIIGCIAQPFQVRRGVYAVNELKELPLPTSGYDLYTIGEIHGVREIHDLFLSYMDTLHTTAGLQDIALELSPTYEQAVNEYVCGDTNSLPDPEYWELVGMDLLDGIREYNHSLSEEEKIRVHIVDINFSPPRIYGHLHIIYQAVGAPDHITLPSLDQIETWSVEDMLTLVDELSAVAVQDYLHHQLQTVKYSIQFYRIRKETGQELPDACLALREEAIAQNVYYVLQHTDTPVLTLCGAWHTQKSQGMQAVVHKSQTVPMTEQPWVQLLPTHVNVYSLFAVSISGYSWVRGEQVEIRAYPSHVSFEDGTTLAEILDSVPDYRILLIDLRLDENASMRIGRQFIPDAAVFDPDVPTGKVYDGFVVVREVSPQDTHSV